MHARNAVHVPQNLSATDTWMIKISQERAFDTILHNGRTDTINTGEDRILDVVEFEAGRHISNEANGMRTVHKLEGITEAKLFHDT